jgi:peptide/nickel transport system permease protein
MSADAPALAAPTPLWRRLLNHRSFMAGFILFGSVVLVALLADLIAPHDPLKNNFRYRLGVPNDVHWLGTDRAGRDVLSRIIHGSRVSLRIGLMVVIVTGVCGAIIGGLAGYFRRIDNVVMRVMDAMMAFPGVLLAIAIAAVLGPSEFNAVLALFGNIIADGRDFIQEAAWICLYPGLAIVGEIGDGLAAAARAMTCALDAQPVAF